MAHSQTSFSSLNLLHLPWAAADLVDVRFSIDGAVNKLFEIQQKLHKGTDESPKIYLFRVTLTVDPFYKAESQVTSACI
jgi:hypothetical protein